MATMQDDYRMNSEYSKEQQAQALMQLQTLVKGQQVQMKILGKCFDKCITAVGSELSDSEQKCIYQCTARLFDTEQFLGNRLQAMAAKH